MQNTQSTVLFILAQLLSSPVLIAQSNEGDIFETLSMGTPTCRFESSITKVEGQKVIQLHSKVHPASNEAGFTEALRASCASCRDELKGEAQKIRRKGTVFFQDKCVFKGCSIGLSVATVPITGELFKTALRDADESFFCIRHPDDLPKREM